MGGAGAAWATRASVNGTAALRTTMLVNGGVNAAGAEAAYVINNRGNLTWQGAVGAGAGGFVSRGDRQSQLIFRWHAGHPAGAALDQPDRSRGHGWRELLPAGRGSVVNRDDRR